MRPKRRLRLVSPAVLALSLGVAVADGAKPADPQADAELLEFLGSIDSGADSQAADDGSWIDYLAQTDISKVAKTTGPNGAPRPQQLPAGPQAPASGDPKND